MKTKFVTFLQNVVLSSSSYFGRTELWKIWKLWKSDVRHDIHERLDDWCQERAEDGGEKSCGHNDWGDGSIKYFRRDPK